MTKSSQAERYQGTPVVDAFDVIAIAMLVGILWFIFKTTVSWT